MALGVGARIWIPCEVRPGPFGDERLVRIGTDDGGWFGFVNVRWLKDPPPEGTSQVLATVVSIEGDRFTARIHGHSPAANLFHGQTERAHPGGSLSA